VELAEGRASDGEAGSRAKQDCAAKGPICTTDGRPVEMQHEAVLRNLGSAHELDACVRNVRLHRCESSRAGSGAVRALNLKILHHNRLRPA